MSGHTTWAEIKNRFTRMPKVRNGEIWHFRLSAEHCTHYLIINPQLWLIIDQESGGFRNVVDLDLLHQMIAREGLHPSTDCPSL